MKRRKGQLKGKGREGMGRRKEGRLARDHLTISTNVNLKRTH